MINKLPLKSLIFDTYFKSTEAMKNICQYQRLFFSALLIFLVPIAFYSFSYPAYVAYLNTIPQTTGLGSQGSSILLLIAINGVQNVILWILRAFLIFILVKLARQTGTFRQVLGISGIAYLAIVPMMVIMCIAGHFTGELYINFSPAIFLGGMRGTPLYGFARGLCLFFIWQHILIAIGIKQLTGNKKCVWIVVIVFLLQILANMPNLMNM